MNNALKHAWEPIISAQMSDSVKMPHELLRRSVRVVRPRDLENVYARPYQELRRLAKGGVLVQLAHGYYAIPPSEWLGDRTWRPEVEPTGLAVAAADHGIDGAALVSISAARVLGFLPRALSVAVVAVPVRRRPLQTVAGRISFWKRSLDRMETQAWRGELGQGRVGTVEQTLLDLAASPKRGDITMATAEEALRGLALAADWERALSLARNNGALAAYRRARWFAQPLVPDAPRLGRPRQEVVSKGLTPREPVDGYEFGIRDD